MKNKIYKGILLAGGLGTRLGPTTLSTSKHLLPIYDKPMIYYSLSVLMLCEIRDIAIIVNENDKIKFQKLLGNGEDLGINITYIIQKKPKGIAEAIILSEEFIDNNNCCLVLGDNIFYGQSFTKILKRCLNDNKGATILCHPVVEPKSFGILNLNKDKTPLKIIEKPLKSKSNLAVTGIYFYDKNVTNIAKSLKFSKRGELEITDLNNIYIKKNNLKYEVLGRGFSWLDTGSHEKLFEAAKFVEAIQSNQGYFVACLEEIAFKNKWINKKQIKYKIKKLKGTSYSNYLKKLIV